MNIASATSITSATSAMATATADQTLPKDLEGACRALEKAFSQIVFQKMREAMVPASSKGADGFARSSAESMLDAQWADLSSQGEGLGLWRSMLRQLDPEGVKSAAGTPDQWSRATSPRARTDLAAGAGLAEPGPRSARPRATVSAATAAAGYRHLDRHLGGAGGVATEGRNQ